MNKNNYQQIVASELRSEQQIINCWKNINDVPLVSICCITYNHEKYIEDAIVGFLRQETTFPFEILIHDDASTDATAEIIRNYEKLYPRLIKAIYQSNNQFSQGKVPSSFNVERALGKYCAVCEGDDYWLSNSHLQDAVDVLKKNKEISIYGAACFKVTGSSIKTYIPSQKMYNLSSYILNGPFIATCSLVTKTELWKRIMDIPIYGLRYFAGDTRLKLICLTEGDMYVNLFPSVVYRKGTEGSWSNRKIDERVIIRELLDNLAITREVGVLSSYDDAHALFTRIQQETLFKGLSLAAEKGNLAWLRFVLLHLKLLSPRYYRSAIASNPLIRKLRNQKKK